MNKRGLKVQRKPSGAWLSVSERFGYVKGVHSRKMLHVGRMPFGEKVDLNRYEGNSNVHHKDDGVTRFHFGSWSQLLSFLRQQ